MDNVSIIEFNTRQVLILSIIVLWLGIYLTKRIKFLNEFNIPAPVTGGLICSLVVALLDIAVDIKVSFDLGLRDMLLLVFSVPLVFRQIFAYLLKAESYY